MANRVAFVTGASRGIGRAIALWRCAARAFDIVVASPELENERAGRRRNPQRWNAEAVTAESGLRPPPTPSRKAFAKRY